MGVLRHRRFRRQDLKKENEVDQDEYDDGDEEAPEDEEADDDDDELTSSSSNLVLPSTTVENKFDKAKAIGEEVIKKVPSKN